AFFYATPSSFVAAGFPQDNRTSAQGVFNLLVLGAGLVIANCWFASLKAQWTGADGVVNYHKLFLVPTGLAIAAMLTLFLFFTPPAARPQETGAASPAK